MTPRLRRPPGRAQDLTFRSPPVCSFAQTSSSCEGKALTTAVYSHDKQMRPSVNRSCSVRHRHDQESGDRREQGLFPGIYGEFFHFFHYFRCFLIAPDGCLSVKTPFVKVRAVDFVLYDGTLARFSQIFFLCNLQDLQELQCFLIVHIGQFECKSELLMCTFANRCK